MAKFKCIKVLSEKEQRLTRAKGKGKDNITKHREHFAKQPLYQ